MTYVLTNGELEQIKNIENSYYMKPLLNLLNEYLRSQVNKKTVMKVAFDKIYHILVSAKLAVDKLLEERERKGEIKDIKQARKSIAGNAFSQMITYLFLQNKIVGNIRPDIFITSQKSKVRGFDKIATVYVDGETQKPDCDLIIFSEKNKKEKIKCIILSLKTSLRERAGQTYKWKLLMEIAISNNAVKNKYNISYQADKMPLVCFATVNFYNEINNPQHRGMFKFFDRAFIAKEINTDFISRLSSLVDFANETL